MTSSKVLEWALLVDFAILVALAIDVWINWHVLQAITSSSERRFR